MYYEAKHDNAEYRDRQMWWFVARFILILAALVFSPEILSFCMWIARAM